MINPCGVVAAFLKLWQVPEYVDPTEQMDPDFEPMAGEETFMAALASHMPEGVWHRYSVELLKAPNGEVFCDEAYLLPMGREEGCDGKCASFECVCPQDPEVVGPPAASAPPVAVDGAPHASPATGFNLPMFKASDLEEIAVGYLEPYMRPDFNSNGDLRFGSRKEQAQHVAEIVVSALTSHLTGLAYDQSQPRTQQMETGQDMGGSMWASECFPQYRKPSQK